MPRQDVSEKKITFKLMIQEPIYHEFGGELINDNKLSYFFKQFFKERKGNTSLFKFLLSNIIQLQSWYYTSGIV